MTPEKAYEHAKKYGPLDITREIVCQDPEYAYYYALDIDKCPREDTREAVCKSSQYAYYYAKEIMQYI